MHLPVEFVPLEPAASLWLSKAGADLGIPAPLARDFARSAVLSLPGLALHLSLWQPQPVPQWIALGLLPRPADCSPHAWSELLLRANCAVSAMCTASVAMSENGDGLLVQRLASRPGEDGISLADELAHLLAIAESLVAGATALSVSARHASPGAYVTPKEPATTTQAATTAMNVQWHQPLLTAALQRLGVCADATQVQTVGVIQANGRSFEVIADSDQRHLLVSTAITKPLTTPALREQALQANLPLMLLTQCAVVLAPHGSALQARWSSHGLEGEAFADWLLDFGQLADSFTSSPLPTAAAPRNPAWT